MTGAMAAGKSTVAQLLAERFERSAHVCGDVFRRMIVSGRPLDRSLRTDTPRLGLWLDNSDLTPAATVDENIARLPKAKIQGD